MNKILFCGLAGIVSLAVASSCFAGDILFYKISRTYGRKGSQGQVFQQQFEARMFTHTAWYERVYVSTYDPAVDDTLETYSKPDGSRWLSHHRATPALSRLIEPALSGKQYDLRKELAAVRVTNHDVMLPAAAASEIGLLWREMLPGLSDEPKDQSTTHVLFIHAPAFIAFSQNNGSVKTGRIAMAAYDTPAYRAFVDIVGDLISACDRGAKAEDPVFARLLDRSRRLRSRLR